MTEPAALLAVGELIRTQKLRIDITTSIGYTAHAPCLLAQLHDAIHLGTETGGRGIPGSRPTIAIDALDLWTWIITDTHHWAHNLGINRRDPQDQHPIPWPGRLLRSCAATAHSTGRTEIADRIQRNAENWTRQITALLTGRVEQRGIRDAACPECVTIQPYPARLIGPRSGPQPTRTVQDIRREEGRDQTYSVPAIVLVTRDLNGVGVLRWLTCLACGWNRALTLTDDTVLAHTSEPLDFNTSRAA